MRQDSQAASAVVQALWPQDETPARSDSQLVQRFLHGTDESAEAAFTVLVERHGPIVHRVCLDVIGNLHDAQDAAQAVFLILARKARSIRKPESLGPWLHGVALRVARRVKSQAAKQKAAERHKADITHRQRDLVERGHDSMDNDDLHNEIDRLPEKYRNPIILCYMQGRTQLEAAQMLGWPLGTVQTRLHRGRERLRNRLSRAGTGLLVLTGADLTNSLSATAGAIDRHWAEQTARAAVRFAAGKTTAGLVAPPAAGLASSVLTAMVGDALKALALIPIALLLVAAGISLHGLGATETKRRNPVLESRLKTSAPQIERQHTLKPTAPQASGEIQDGSDGPLQPGPPADLITQIQAEATPASPSATSVVAPPTPERILDDVGLSKPLNSSDRLRTLALLQPRSERALSLGRELFERVWTREDPRGHGGDGLGPVFNGQSCVACHNLGGSGGAGTVDRNIEIVTAIGGDLADYTGFSYSFSMDLGAGRFEYRFGDGSQTSPNRQRRADLRLAAGIHAGFQQSRSVVLHRYSTDPTYNAWRESVPGRHGTIVIRSAERNPPPLFGSGLIDTIPAEAIEAAAKRRHSGSAQVKGRVSRLKDGRVGRFGWKAQTATLEEFVLSAAAGEMGLEVPGRHQAADPRLPGVAARGLDMDQDECNLLIDYVRSFPAPVATRPADDKVFSQVKAGEATFKTIGCTACHLPKLGVVEGIYSDLLLHDMGPALADADTYTVFSGEPLRAVGPEPVTPDRARPGTEAASAREWRTPPLWGLRASGPYLHDGRAAGISEAITMHGGQGATAARRFAELPPRRRQQVEAFLTSLAPSSAD
jgi:RNA polymerase sigma factor (sigma-70 family)